MVPQAQVACRFSWAPHGVHHLFAYDCMACLCLLPKCCLVGLLSIKTYLSELIPSSCFAKACLSQTYLHKVYLFPWWLFFAAKVFKAAYCPTCLRQVFGLNVVRSLRELLSKLVLANLFLGTFSQLSPNHRFTSLHPGLMRRRFKGPFFPFSFPLFLPFGLRSL